MPESRTKNLSAEVEAWVRDQSTRQIEGYLRRWRPYAHLDAGSLKEMWIRGFKQLVADVAEGKASRAYIDDLEAELTLRGDEPPWDAIQRDLEELTNLVRARHEAIKRDPARYEEVTHSVDRHFAAFLDERRKKDRRH